MQATCWPLVLACWHLDPGSASLAPCCRRSSPMHACATAFVRGDVCTTSKAFAASGRRGDAGRNRRRWRVVAALTAVRAVAVRAVVAALTAVRAVVAALTAVRAAPRVRACTQGCSHLN